jgi:hypothetical protein
MIRREYEKSVKDCQDKTARIAWLYKQRKIDNAKTVRELDAILNTPWNYYYEKVEAFLKKTS